MWASRRGVGAIASADQIYLLIIFRIILCAFRSRFSSRFSLRFSFEFEIQFKIHIQIKVHVSSRSREPLLPLADSAVLF